MPYVEVTLPMLCASPQSVYVLIKNMERYPEFMPNLMSVRVISREGNTTVTEWKSKVDGLQIQWKEIDCFDDENLRITYRQTAGDLQKFEGEWSISPSESGATVTLTVDFELGIPMIAGMVHPILKKKIQENCVAMLTAIEKELRKSIDSHK